MLWRCKCTSIRRIVQETAEKSDGLGAVEELGIAFAGELCYLCS